MSATGTITCCPVASGTVSGAAASVWVGNASTPFSRALIAHCRSTTGAGAITPGARFNTRACTTYITVRFTGCSVSLTAFKTIGGAATTDTSSSTGGFFTTESRKIATTSHIAGTTRLTAVPGTLTTIASTRTTI
jgi:hypothetical protein